MASALPAWLSKAPQVRMACARSVQLKLDKLIQDGPGRLHLIVDFDLTLSRYHQDGQQCGYIHEAFRYAGRDNVCSRLDTLATHFEPIEFSPIIPVEDKVPHMVEYWTKIHDSIVEGNFNKSEFPDILANTPVAFRDRVERFFELTSRSGMPVVIFSAGLADMIECFIEMKMGSIPDNVTVIANRMVFAENGSGLPVGNLVAFTDKIVHIFNKNRDALTASERQTLAPKISNRPNLLLFGDSISDGTMSLGIEHTPCANETIGPESKAVALRVGFYNQDPKKDEVKFEKFMETFDIVLVDDQSFDVPNKLCQLILDEIGDGN